MLHSTIVDSLKDLGKLQQIVWRNLAECGEKRIFCGDIQQR